ncbi:MAG TPA: hypothetical protein VJP87_07370 [Candidatus Acidoferrales bacterium]|nr:hypothetical protein [Candidatus Acidoferrales bacterium]
MLTDHRGASPSNISGQKSIFRRPLLYSSCLVVLVALYVGWIIFSRWYENRQIEQQASAQRAEKQRELDRAAVEQMGGKDLAIQMLYASPKSLARGQSAQLCYGVANAKHVKLEPQNSPVWPSPSRCVEVSPVKTTTYTLTIDDGAGHTQTQSIEVNVR